MDEGPLPIIEELKAKLLCLLAADEDRGIVLVKERFTTEALSAFVREDPQLSELRDGLPLVRPTTLVGKEEMSDIEQLESLRKFRSGECNLLIAKHPHSASLLSPDVQLNAFEAKYQNRFPEFCKDFSLNPQI